MAVPQFVVIGLLLWWGRPYHAIVVVSLLAAQMLFMIRMLDSPKERAPWYNLTGILAYVFGMLVCAFAVRDLL
jgi:chlorophyll synthase